MCVERMLFVIAGTMVLLSTALGVVVSPWWFCLTGFVGVNLFQSGFTNWCPAMWLLEKLGMKHCPDCGSRGHAAKLSRQLSA